MIRLANLFIVIFSYGSNKTMYQVMNKQSFPQAAKSSYLDTAAEGLPPIRPKRRFRLTGGKKAEARRDVPACSKYSRRPSKPPPDSWEPRQRTLRC